MNDKAINCEIIKFDQQISFQERSEHIMNTQR